METKINPNQINGAKILNVVPKGSIVRSISKFSNFSQDNYLFLGNVMEGGFIGFDEIKDFSNFFSTANSWEINGSFKLTDLANTWQPIISVSTDAEYNGIVVQKDGNNKLNFYFSKIDEDGINTSFSLSANTKYYFRFQFTGTEYKAWVNTDGQTYDNTTLIGTVNSSNKCGDCDSFYIGRSSYNGEYIDGGEIDLLDWSIKKDGNIWWEGVTEI